MFGYRPADVRAALAARDGAIDVLDGELREAKERLSLQGAELDAAAIELAGRERRIDDLEQVASALSGRVVERERELREVRAALARARSDEEAGLTELIALVRELETLRRQARGQATRMRLRALREAAEIADRVGELSRGPAGVRERLLDSLSAALERVGGDEADDAAGAATPHDVAALNGRSAAEGMFAGLVEVEIGPLSDFAQLVGFEDAARAIDATSEISVKRFSEGRATLSVSLSEPVELLRELEERCDLEFAVRDQRSDRLVLDVGDGDADAGAEAEAA